MRNEKPDADKNSHSGINRAFLAPEVLSGGPTTEKCDVWSVGAILHMLVVGEIDLRDQNSSFRTDDSKPVR